ncbi:M1 family metallopeptidase [Croceitalea sp. MTPC5]|uniref:M1 family metallopeptidase n=1 Tax=Croceitalea sp. MTPC5 TaxID=3056565 RepID=UPI002B380DB5|nr:M1 family metallopeptidase [Croceitalea sp. MTPC5]
MRLILFVFLIFSTFPLFAQQQLALDFTNVNVEVFPMPTTKEIIGRGVYTFNLNHNTDSVFIDAIAMTFTDITLNGKRIEHKNDGKRLGFKAPDELGAHKLYLSYSCTPKQTVYFMGWDDKVKGNEQIWTQGQGKYTSHWLPSFDNMNEKIEIDLILTIDRQLSAIANGKLIGGSEYPPEEKFSWSFDMQKPMSSYLAAFVVGNFDKKVIKSSSGVPIELYYEPKDSLKVEPTYRYTKEIFDFLEGEIGVSYPWQNYKQVPVQDFLYAGMENTACTIFSNQYVIDSTAFVDKNYVNVNAHELAHQWFGNLVTEASGDHHWLHEGFATYYAYLAEKELFGNEHFYWKLFDVARTLRKRSERGEGEALVDPKSDSLTFYEKGAWALVMLREIIGDSYFSLGIRAYLTKHQFSNATVDNLIVEMESASGIQLDQYRKTWLESETFPWEQTITYLGSKSKSIKLFNDMQVQNTDSAAFNEKKLMSLWSDEMPKAFKRNFLFEYGLRISDSTLVTIIKGESLAIRQAIALTIPEVGIGLKTAFEQMLMDASYVTQESVLFKLWSAFPADRKTYLDKLNGVIGLPNKNVRLLWLTLALLTQDYNLGEKRSYYDEFNGYTNLSEHFEVRQLAFQYLYRINAFNDASLLSLVRASTHDVWQFKKSSRNLIRQMGESSDYKTRLLDISDSLTMKQKDALLKLLTP